MVVHNVDRNGTISESSKSSTGRTPPGNSGPLPVDAVSEDAISEFHSPINKELRQPDEEDNVDARPIMAIDREEGALRNVFAENAEGDKEQAIGSYHINDKITLFLEETFGAVNGPVEVMSLGCSMQQVEDTGHVLVEDLDCDTRHMGLQSAGWAGLGSLPTQVNVPEASLGATIASSMTSQDQNINQRKGPSSGKCEGHQFTSKVLRRRKSAKAKVRLNVAM
ncbi:hypothetical protein Ancab_022979 [Ancistrocladus abbreviatus]